MFEFRYELNDQDYLDFNIYHHFHSPAIKRQMLVSRWMVPILFSAILWLVVVVGAESWMRLFTAIVFGVASVVWVVFFRRIYIILLKRMIKRMKKSGKLPYSRQATLQFEADGIEEITEDTQIRILYSKVEKIVKTQKTLYIYFGAVQAIILPLSLFEDENRLSVFMAFLEEKCTGAEVV